MKLEERLRATLADPGWDVPPSGLTAQRVFAAADRQRRRHIRLAVSATAAAVALVVAVAALITDGGGTQNPRPAGPGETDLLVFDHGRLSNGQSLPFTTTGQPPVRTAYGVLALDGTGASASLGLLTDAGDWQVLARNVTSFATDGQTVAYGHLASPEDQTHVTLTASHLPDNSRSTDRTFNRQVQVAAYSNGTALVTLGDAISAAAFWRVPENSLVELPGTGVALAMNDHASIMVAQQSDSPCIALYDGAPGAISDGACVKAGEAAFSADGHLAIAQIDGSTVLLPHGDLHVATPLQLPSDTDQVLQLTWDGAGLLAVIERPDTIDALSCGTEGPCHRIAAAPNADVGAFWLVEDRTDAAQNAGPRNGQVRVCTGRDLGHGTASWALDGLVLTGSLSITNISSDACSLSPATISLAADDGTLLTSETGPIPVDPLPPRSPAILQPSQAGRATLRWGGSYCGPATSHVVVQLHLPQGIRLIPVDGPALKCLGDTTYYRRGQSSAAFSGFAPH